MTLLVCRLLSNFRAHPGKIARARLIEANFAAHVVAQVESRYHMLVPEGRECAFFVRCASVSGLWCKLQRTTASRPFFHEGYCFGL